MHIDWYDRSILRFVLDAGLPAVTADSPATPVQFGMSARRLANRFEAVVDLYTASDLPLDDADVDLVRRAARYRAAHATTV